MLMSRDQFNTILHHSDSDNIGLYDTVAADGLRICTGIQYDITLLLCIYACAYMHGCIQARI